jgi:hypothetical protein
LMFKATSLQLGKNNLTTQQTELNWVIVVET